MTFTSRETAEGMMWAILYFALGMMGGTILELGTVGIVGATTSRSTSTEQLFGEIVGAVMAGVLIGFISAVGACLIAVVLGILLAGVTAVARRRITNARARFAIFATIGFVAATATEYFWIAGNGFGFSEVPANWLLSLNLAIVVLIAAGSTGLAGHRMTCRQFTRTVTAGSGAAGSVTAGSGAADSVEANLRNGMSTR